MRKVKSLLLVLLSFSALVKANELTIKRYGQVLILEKFDEDAQKKFEQKSFPVSPDSSNLPKESSVKRFVSLKNPNGQGPRGNCSFFASASLMETYVNHDNISEQCLSFFVRNSRGTGNSPESSSFEDNIEHARTVGYFLEEECPYNPDDKDDIPDNIRRGLVQPRRVTANFIYRWLEEDPITQVKKVIAEGYPAGIQVYVAGESWNSDSNLIIKTPTPDELKEDCPKEIATGTGDDYKRCPGHLIVVVGYDDDTEQFEILNSWGNRWKNSGFGFMTYDYYRRLSYGVVAW